MLEQTDWDDWRKCQVCGAGTGAPCVARSGRVVYGRTDGVVVKLPQPHTVRVRRSGR